MKTKCFIAVGIALMLSLAIAGVTAGQGSVPNVCYYSGLDGLPQAFSMTSIVFDPVSGQVYFERTINGGQTNPYNAIMPVLVPGTAQEDIYINGIFAGSFLAAFPALQFPMSDCVGSWIGDGRINDGPNELGAPLAAYCADGSIEVWEIDANAQGVLGFTASASAIDNGLAQAASSGIPILIDSGLGNSLYASPTGELAIMGPDFREDSKTYRFDFPGNRCS